jgi:hypothetical protein
LTALEMAAFLDRLATGPVSPLVFAAYCDLVLALNSNDLGEAQAILSEIAEAPNTVPGAENHRSFGFQIGRCGQPVSTVYRYRCEHAYQH